MTYADHASAWGRSRTDRGAVVRPPVMGAAVPGESSQIRAGAFCPSSRIFSGSADQLASVRHHVRDAIGDHPCLDVAELVASELAANAIAHTASGLPGGKFEVWATSLADGRVGILVADQGGPTVPEPKPVDFESESGRGLDLVRTLAAMFFVSGDENGREVLAVLTS